MFYYYGMKLRGFSPGCQPLSGIIYRANDKNGEFYDILIYDRRLTTAETDYYDLVYLGETEKIGDTE